MVPPLVKISHSPGHLINPKLFFALEQMKTNKRDFNIEDSPKKVGRIIVIQSNCKENSYLMWLMIF